jgi:hypothetical protein
MLGHVFHALRTRTISKSETSEIVSALKAHSDFSVFDTRLSCWAVLFYCWLGLNRFLNIKGLKRLFGRLIQLV